MKTYVAVAGLLAVAGCGGGAGAAAAPQAAPTSQTLRAFPGASGLLAALSGSTLQVQSETAQTAVTYSAATTFRSTVKAAFSDVRVGSCVMVRTASDGTAESVSVTEPVDGGCFPGPGGMVTRGGPGGTPPPGAFQSRPSGAPRFGGGAVGAVTSVSGSGFVVASSRPGASTAPVTVTTTAATTYTVEKKASAAALKVGECVTARGTADSTGTVAATAISIRPAVNGVCTMAFGGPRG